MWSEQGCENNYLLNSYTNQVLSLGNRYPCPKQSPYNCLIDMALADEDTYSRLFFSEVSLFVVDIVVD